MKELLTYIVQSLVDHPDEVSVTERKADGETVYEVRVADGDMGKVIGRQGRIVKQIRILMRAVAQRKQADPYPDAGRRPEKGQEDLRGDPRLKSRGNSLCFFCFTPVAGRSGAERPSAAPRFPQPRHWRAAAHQPGPGMANAARRYGFEPSAPSPLCNMIKRMG